MINVASLGLSILSLRRVKVNNAPNTIAVTSDDVCNSDNIDAISVKGAENYAFLVLLFYQPFICPVLDSLDE